MNAQRGALAAIFLFALASPALAQERPQETPQQQAPEKAQIPQPRYEIACRGQFGPKATHADLVKVYGARNVTFEEVGRAEGEMVKASVVFPNDPKRRIEIEWFDEAKRARPSVITVFGPMNQWIGPLGIRNGMTIQEIERRAGKPFKINGFGTDVSGHAYFTETKLDKLPGGCSASAHFDIEGGQPPEHLKRFIGEVEIDSNDPDLLTLKPKMWIYSLRYAPAEN